MATLSTSLPLSPLARHKIYTQIYIHTYIHTFFQTRTKLHFAYTAYTATTDDGDNDVDQQHTGLLFVMQTLFCCFSLFRWIGILCFVFRFPHLHLYVLLLLFLVVIVVVIDFDVAFWNSFDWCSIRCLHNFQTHMNIFTYIRTIEVRPSRFGRGRRRRRRCRCRCRRFLIEGRWRYDEHHTREQRSVSQTKWGRSRVGVTRRSSVGRKRVQRVGKHLKRINFHISLINTMPTRESVRSQQRYFRVGASEEVWERGESGVT